MRKRALEGGLRVVSTLLRNRHGARAILYRCRLSGQVRRERFSTRRSSVLVASDVPMLYLIPRVAIEQPRYRSVTQKAPHPFIFDGRKVTRP